jgi:hypothetical protein
VKHQIFGEGIEKNDHFKKGYPLSFIPYLHKDVII